MAYEAQDDDLVESHQRDTLREHFKSAGELNVTTLDFLKIDLDTALTFAGIALQSEHDAEKRQRNLHNARVGYDTVQRFMRRVNPASSDAKILAKKIKQLKSELMKLGERF